MEYINLIQQYKNDVREICKDRMSEKEQKELLIRIKNGDKEAENEFIEKCLRYILSIVKFKGNIDNFMDSIQDANLALCEIIKDKKKLPDDYKDVLGFFGQYVGWIVLKKETKRDYNLNRPNFCHIIESISTRDELRRKLGEEPTYEQIARECHPDSKNIKKSITAIKEHERAYAMMFQKSIYDKIEITESVEVKDSIIDKRPLQSEILDKKLNKEHLNKALKKLSDRQRKTLELVYGLVDNIERSNEEIGKILNIHPNTITRIKRISFKILKKELPEIIQKQVEK